MTTVEQNRGTRTEAAEIVPFGGWESTPAHTMNLSQPGIEPRGAGPSTSAGGCRPRHVEKGSIFGDRAALFRFPAADDPAPAPGRLLGMAVYAAVLGLAGVGVGLRAIVTVFGGTAFWYVPALSLFGLLSVALVVGSFLSIHRPALPWLLLVAATAPLAVDIAIAALY